MKCKRLIVLLLLTVILTGCSFAPRDFDFSNPSDAEQIIDEQTEQNRVTEDNAYNSFYDRAESVYYETLDRVSDVSNTTGEKVSLSEMLFRGGYEFYSTIRIVAPFVVPGSMFLGILIWIVARKNKSIRRVGVYGFIIGIPLFIIAFIYGFGILMDLFLF